MLKKLREMSVPLLAGVAGALVWANVDPSSYGAFVHWLHFPVNDIFMALFFAIAAGELTEACLPGGALNPPARAINPLFSTVGGVVGPAAVYLAWSAVTGDSAIRSGWGIPTATDIALAWLIARAIFGSGHPAVSFLLLLAVADDGIGLAIIAVFYPDPAHPVQPVYLLLVGAAVLFAWLLRRRQTASWIPYLLGPGALSWAGMQLAGVHPALSLVAVVPFMPMMSHDDGLFGEADESGHTDTLNRFQAAFQAPVDYGLFGFGLANAGVVFSSAGNATWAVLFALVVGKTVGIFCASMLAHSLGFHLPDGVSRSDVALVSFIAALGLTVALFVAGVAFTDPSTIAAAKMGALFSIGVAPIALGLARLRRRKPDAVDETEHVPDSCVIVDDDERFAA